ncbi:MAG: glycoside hydrolase family 9 protein [Spirochaetia bacterium]
MTEVLSYFTSQRCEGIYDQADRHMSFFGAREERVDVHGGWYDASGDVSKYLSHLSYANYMNPQQIPLVVWSLLYSFKLVTQQKTVNWKYLPERIISEALFGADFLVRMQDKAGYFYMTVFDGWTMDINKREICSYSTIKGIKSEAYEASFRQGGGMAIAALAGMSGMHRSGEFDSQTYLEAAKKGFRHLEENNTRYLDDGKENIIDDYCALLAASELFLACGEEDFLRAAVFRAENLINRISRDQSFDGWWRADGQGEHQNESGYWWQGENARLASLCTVGSLASRYFKAEKEIVSALRKYAQDQLDWILGLNPFDRCMLHGKGRNNPEYTKFNLKNRPGGICNGITSGYDDEQDIEFLPSRHRSNLGQNWRWTEQWLPHAAWYFLAVCAGAE